MDVRGGGGSTLLVIDLGSIPPRQFFRLMPMKFLVDLGQTSSKP